VPRSGQVSPYRRIRFEVGGFSRITWMKVEFGNGDWVETRFRGWKTLPGISEHYFRYRKEE